MSEQFLEACLRDDLHSAGAELGVSVPQEWLDRKGLMHFRLGQLRTDPAYQPFALRAIVLRSTNEMVGGIAFHAPPDSDDLKRIGLKGLELGYSLFTNYRRQGYAQEASLGLISWAKRTHGVESFIVSISPENEASMALARKLGYVKVAEQLDPIDGPEAVLVLSGQALEHALGLLQVDPSDGTN